MDISNSNPPKNVPFDPIVEARLMTNACHPLDATETHLSDCAHMNTGCLPPSDNLKSYLMSKLDLHLLKGSGENRRLATVKSCLNRYSKGVPIDKDELTKHKAALCELQQRVNDSGLTISLDGNGEITPANLENLLPPSIARDWPKDSKGDLCVTRDQLIPIDNDVSRSLLDAKKLHKGRFLSELEIDDDGRHRSWANPFGTTTGRENPKGWSFARLPKVYRSIIQPTEGMTITVIDYQQQEPAIISALSDDQYLLDAYRNGDLYECIRQSGPWHDQSRSVIKTMIIAFLYGAEEWTFTKEFGISHSTASQWINELRELFKKQLHWLDVSAHKAYQIGYISCLDWGMHVTPATRIKSLKNWPIQATGADILRRACSLLDANNISVIGCMHDSIMIEVSFGNHQKIIADTGVLMEQASAEVLNGFRLNTTVERVSVNGNHAYGGSQ